MPGNYVISKYESEQTVGGATIIAPIRVQPETLAADLGATNDPPDGAINVDFSVAISRGRRSLGIHPRFVTLRLGETSGDVPSGYKPGGTLRVPVLTKALFDSITKGETVTYQGKSMTVASKTPETVK